MVTLAVAIDAWAAFGVIGSPSGLAFLAMPFLLWYREMAWLVPGLKRVVWASCYDRLVINAVVPVCSFQFQSGLIYDILHLMQPSAEPVTSALNQLLEPLSRTLSSDAAKQILALRIEPTVQARIDDLADRCNDGALTAPERTEYEGYVEGISVINILKAKARRVLVAQPPTG
jgi:hypothetical protein